MSKEERCLQWGYESYRDAETGEVKSDYVDLLNKQDEQIADLEAKLAEKEKEIEELKAQRHIYLIELLERVESYIEDCTYIKEPDYTNVCEYIRALIKEIKGE